MTKEISVARNCRDGATTDNGIKRCLSVFDFAAQVADAAKDGEIDRATMIEMICDALATAAWRFKPREELLNQVCADMR